MLWQPTDVFMVLGRRGSGKSYLGEIIRRAYPRVVTIDSIHEHSDGEIVKSFEEFSALILEKNRNREKSFHIIVQFDLEKQDNSEEFNQVLRVLYYMGGVFIRIEEIHNFTTPHLLPHWLRQCLTTGRHRKMGMLFLSQMPRFCNKAMISQAGHLFCGQLHERSDVEYVRSVLGERAYELLHFPERKFLYFLPGQPIKVVKNSLD